MTSKNEQKKGTNKSNNRFLVKSIYCMVRALRRKLSRIGEEGVCVCGGGGGGEAGEHTACADFNLF